MYYKYNADAAKAMRPEGDSYIKNVPQEKQFSPKADSKHRIRVMPPWSNIGVIFKHMKMHYRVGQGQTTFLCPDNFGEQCPFCQTHAVLRKEYEKYKPDVDSARPANRYWSNIVFLDNKERGVQVYSYGWTVYKMIYEIQDSGMYGDISDPSLGRDLLLTRTGSGRQARDAIYADPNTSKLENPKWLDEIFDLDTIFVKPNLEAVNAAFRSQPWKVYTPPEQRQAAKVTGEQLSEQPAAQLKSEIPPPADAAQAETSPPTQEQEKVVDATKAQLDPMEEIDKLERELAAQEAAKKK